MNLKVWISSINHPLPETCISIPVHDSYSLCDGGVFLRQGRLSFGIGSWAGTQNVFEQDHLAFEGQQAIIIQVL